MRKHAKIVVTALVTTIVFALAANASARSFSVSERESEDVFFSFAFEAAGNNITCPMTLLEHYLERTIAKSQTQVGAIRHFEPINIPAPPCTGGTVTVLTETLPWKLNYVSFGGRLPEITSIRESMIGIALRLSASFGECLVGTTALKPAFAEVLVNGEAGAGRGGVTGIRMDERAGIPLSGGGICSLAGESHFSGTGTLLNLPRTASITVRLI